MGDPTRWDKVRMFIGGIQCRIGTFVNRRIRGQRRDGHGPIIYIGNRKTGLYGLFCERCGDLEFLV